MADIPALADGDRGGYGDRGPLTVLTAVAVPAVEAGLVAGFGDPSLGILVVRRCVDVVELLAAAAMKTARAALVSSDLRGLDRAALAQLAESGLAVVGLAADEAGERLLHQLGADLVTPAGASAEQVAGALRAAAAAGPRAASAAPALPGAAPGLSAGAESSGPGRVLAVWGAAGSPGRTTIALGLADAYARRGLSTLLIDADPYGGCIATLTGLLDEAPGLAAACRAANAGGLDVARLAGCCRTVSNDLRVLTGLSDPHRWPELRASSLEVVLSLSRWLADVTVIDCGFSLEDDEELAYDTAAPRRNAATLTAVGLADLVVAVGSADPVGVSRLIRDLPRLTGVLDSAGGSSGPDRVVVVANRLRGGLLPGDPRAQVEQALARHAGVPLFAAVPMDTPAADAAHGRGQLVSEAAPDSPLFRACAALADALIPAPGRHNAAVRRGWRPTLRGRHRGSLAER